PLGENTLNTMDYYKKSSSATSYITDSDMGMHSTGQVECSNDSYVPNVSFTAERHTEYTMDYYDESSGYFMKNEQSGIFSTDVTITFDTNKAGQYLFMKDDKVTRIDPKLGIPYVFNYVSNSDAAFLIYDPNDNLIDNEFIQNYGKLFTFEDTPGWKIVYSSGSEWADFYASSSFTLPYLYDSAIKNNKQYVLG
nr:hypothetical protein [Clostridia bacterium]